MDLCDGWSDFYLVGDLLIDGEHKKIIEMTCTFKTFAEQNRLEYREALDLVREVMYHITTHFQHEEFLLDVYGGDPEGIKHHKEEHRRFYKILSSAIQEVQDQKSQSFQDACLALIGDLHQLIADHIATVDKETLGPCLAEHSKKQFLR